MKKSVSVVLALLIMVLNGWSVPKLRLPFLGGEIWICSQGNSSCPNSNYCTHYVGRDGCKIHFASFLR